MPRTPLWLDPVLRIGDGRVRLGREFGPCVVWNRRWGVKRPRLKVALPRLITVSWWPEERCPVLVAVRPARRTIHVPRVRLRSPLRIG